MNPATVELFRRVSEQAAKRGERVIGAYGSHGGEHWRFEFARIGRKAAAATPPPSPQRSVPRGAVRAQPSPLPAGLRQGTLF